MTQSERGGRIPADSFRIRLAIVRTEMGWNYDQAEAATGIGSESWRQWEKGLRHCTDVIGASRKIAEATSFDQTWLALGGPLSREEEIPRPARPKRSVTGSNTPVSKRSIRGCMTTTRRLAHPTGVVCTSYAA